MADLEFRFLKGEERRPFVVFVIFRLKFKKFSARPPGARIWFNDIPTGYRDLRRDAGIPVRSTAACFISYFVAVSFQFFCGCIDTDQSTKIDNRCVRSGSKPIARSSTKPRSAAGIMPASGLVLEYVSDALLRCCILLVLLLQCLD